MVAVYKYGLTWPLTDFSIYHSRVLLDGRLLAAGTKMAHPYWQPVKSLPGACMLQRTSLHDKRLVVNMRARVSTRHWPHCRNKGQSRHKTCAAASNDAKDEMSCALDPKLANMYHLW